jgi:gliding motility-associated-like protein
MKVWLLFLVQFISFFFNLSAQSYFEKIYSDVTSLPFSTPGGIEMVNTLRYNNYYYQIGMSAYQDSPIKDTRKILLIKLDSLGNLIKLKFIYGTKGSDLNYGDILHIMSDSSFIFSAMSTSFSVNQLDGYRDIIFLKFDKNLNILALKSIGGNSSEEYPKSELTNDKGIIMVCGSSSFSPPNTYVVKLDSNLNFQWSRVISGPNNFTSFPNRIKQTKDNGYIIAGLTQINSAGEIDMFAVKLDSTGNILWTKTYGIYNNYDQFMDVIELESGNLIFYGSTIDPKGKLVLLKTDKFGNILSHKVFYTFYYLYDSGGFGPLHIIQYDKKTNQLLMDANMDININSPNAGTPRRKQLILVIDTNLNINNTLSYDFNYFNGADHIWVNYFYQYNSISNNRFLINGVHRPVLSLVYTRALFTVTDTSGNTCHNDTLQLFSDTVPFQVSSGGSIIAVNQGTLLSWTPLEYEQGIDSTLCFCPDIPVTISTNPVNCFSNGSATISPTSAPPNHFAYSWFPNVSSSYTANNLPAGTYTCFITDTSNGCKKQIILKIDSNLTLPLSTTKDTILCNGHNITLFASGANSYTWSNGSTNNSITVQPSSTTTYTVWAQAGVCTQSAAITISVVPNPTAGLLPFPSVVNAGDTITLSAFGGSYYEWSPTSIFGNNNSPTAVITPTASFDFCLKAENVWGCYDTICRHIQVEGSCFNFIIPNIFTPNNDGINDYWLIPFQCPQLIKDFHLSIFDRWGIKLFETTKLNAGWDGRTISGEPVPTGTYYYVAEFYINNKKQELKGYLTLLR